MAEKRRPAASRDSESRLPAMNEVLAEALSKGVVQTPDGRGITLHSHIPRLECEAIQAWIIERSPCRILEVGFGYGISCLFVCDAVCDTASEYHVIDPYQHSEFEGVGLANVERAGFGDLVTFHEERSELCLPRLLSSGKSFDFVLVDGSHRLDEVLLDFILVNRLLEIGGVVVFDDVQLPSIEKVLKHIATYECYRPLPVPEGVERHLKVKARQVLGLPRLRVAAFEKTVPDERDWDWFRDF